MRTVKAAVMVKPDQIETQEFPYPQIDEHSLLIATEMCGICGTDKHTYRGETTQYGGTGAESTTPFPIIPGHEIVGTVAEIGSRARTELEFYGKELDIDDRVVMCPDILCGECYYCKHTAGFRSVRISRATETRSPVLNPHICSAAGRSISTSAPMRSSTKCRKGSNPESL
ncbi:MAG: alcohol dehydrogenase catalytic domain-containing protein [Candidatus Bipolaricaulia bacterium]